LPERDFHHYTPKSGDYGHLDPTCNQQYPRNGERWSDFATNNVKKGVLHKTDVKSGENGEFLAPATSQDLDSIVSSH
jgi:hypothetical protein